MKIIYLFTFGFFLLFANSLSAQQLQWAKNMGKTGADEALATAVDATGNVYTTGYFEGTSVNFSPTLLSSAGGRDAFIEKRDANGNLLWVQRIGSIGQEEGRGIALDNAGNVYVTGVFQATVDFDPSPAVSSLNAPIGAFDAFVLKLTNAGNFVWVKSAGVNATTFFSGTITWTNIYSTGIVVDATGNSFTVGYFENAGYRNVVVMRLSTTGTTGWMRLTTSMALSQGLGIALDASEDIYITGDFQGTIDFGGGNSFSTSGNRNIFLSKLTRGSGTIVWAKNLGGSGNDSGRALKIDASGNIYLTGAFSSTVDFGGTGNTLASNGVATDLFVGKFDNVGTALWVKSIGGTNTDIGTGLGIVGNNIYLIGTFWLQANVGSASLLSAGRDDMLLTKLDNTGNFVWARRMGGSGADKVNAIALTADENIYLAGSFSASANLDPSGVLSPLTVVGGTDAFINKIKEIPDNNSRAVAPTTQVPAQNLALGTLGVEVFRFSIADLATSDGFATRVSQVQIQQGTGNTVAGWTGKIIDAKLYIGATEVAAIATINATNLTFAISAGSLSVANANNATISLKISLASTGLSNGDKLAFQLPTTGHNFTTHATESSSFAATFPATVLSNPMNIDTSLPTPTFQNLKTQWVKTTGSTGDDNGYIQTDGQGNIYNAGAFTGTVDFDPSASTFNLTSAGSKDWFIRKLDKDGNFIWAKRIGGINDEASSFYMAISQQGDMYATGYFQYMIDFNPDAGVSNLTPAGGADIFILKLDKDGNFVWAKSIGGTGNDYPGGIAIDAQENVHIDGSFQNTVDFDPNAGTFPLTSVSTNDIFVLKLDKDGNFVWAKQVGGTASGSGYGIAIDGQGNVYAPGFFHNGTADFNPGAGTFPLTTVGVYDMFVLKLDKDGNFVWAKSVGGTGYEIAYVVKIDSQGNVYTTGRFNNTVDFDPGAGVFSLTSVGGDDIFIQKLDKDGNFVWAKSMGGSGDDVGSGLAFDAQDNIYVTCIFQLTADFDPGGGIFNLTSAGGDDTSIQKLDKNGNFIWVKQIGGTGNDYVSVNIDVTNNDIYMGGSFQNTVDFDPSSCTNTLTSAGNFDIFTLKMSQESVATDKDALADLPATQTAAQSVSMGVQDVEVFKFKIKDLGAFDCLPTIVRQIRLQQGTGNTVANWTGKITGAKIFIGTTELSSTLTMSATSLNFALSGSTLTVPNGTNQEITVKISLASSGFVNGDKLAFQIPTVSHLLTADASGSPFATVFPSIVLSNLLTIDASLPVPLPTVQDLKLEWVKGAGGTGDDRGHDLVLDAQGNVYTTGWFNGTVDFDPSAGVFNLTSAGLRDIYIQKLSKDGNFIWAKRVGGTGYDAGFSINIDTQGNIYTTGYFQDANIDFDPNAGVFNLSSAGVTDIFIQKLDKDGNFIWAKRMGSSLDDYGLSVAFDAQDNIYTTGYFSGTADFDPNAGIFNLTSAGGTDIFIQKLDTNGNLVWAKRIGGTGNDSGGYELIINAQNNIYCTGFFEGIVDFDPNAGVFNLTSAGSLDAFVLKLDTDGNFIWAKSMGSASSDEGISMTPDKQGNVYIVGRFQGTADFDPNASVFNLTSAGSNDGFIQKLDKDGNLVWAKSIGGSGSDRCLNVIVDTQSNVYVLGQFDNTVDFDPNAGVFNLTSAGLQDVFIQKLDANGNFIWAKTMGGSGNEFGFGMTVDAENNIYFTGLFQTTVDFDPSSCLNTLTVVGDYDIFTLKLRQVSANTDKDALAVVPTVQVAGTLLPIGVVDESVFKFKLQDLGVYDCTPTLLRQIRIQQGAGNTVANWAGKIVAAKLFIGASQVTAAVAINATDIVFTITGTNLQLLNSEEKEIALKISLASTGFVDGDKFAFQIPAVSSGLVSDASGSQFATTLPTDLLSGIFILTISKPLDENSVAAPTTQVPAQDASMGVVDLPVFKFTLQDEGTVDGLPTVVSQVFIQQGAGNTVADWTGKIIGAKLFNGVTDLTAAVNISESAITFSGLSLSIANGGSAELTLKVSLAATGFTNGDKFAFQIPSVSHNLQASANNSSQFANSLPDKVASEILTIVVVPDLIVTTAETHQGNYNNVTIKSTGELTLSGNISSAGVFKIETGGKLLVGNCFTVTGAGSFVMEANTTLQVCSPDGITLSGATGNIQLTGTRTYSEASYIFNGTVPQLTGNGLPATILNLTLNNTSGATLTNDVGVKYLVDLQNGDLTSNGKLTLLSTATQTGMIVQKVDGTNSVIGTATIQRHVTGGQLVYSAAYNGVGGYHYFSSPLQNGTVADFVDDMPLALNPSYDFVVPYSGAFPNFYQYRENRLLPNAGNDVFEKGWESPANTSQSLVPQRGYIANVSAGTLIDFTGLLNNGTLNTTLSRGVFSHSGWQLMGNPYPAPISWTAVANKNTNIHGQVLRRIPTGQYAGTWASYINGVGQNGATDEIALAQGFFVRANIDNAAFQMDNSVRLNSYTNPTFFRTEDASNTQKDGLIRLQLSQGKNADETAIYFEQGATENFDYRYDADRVQYNSSPIPSVFTVSQDSKLLAINGLPVFKDNYHIPLTMYAYTTGKHSLKLQELAYFKQYLQVYLEDKLLDTFHNLTLQPDYVFDISSVGFVKDRFVLRFTDQVGKDGALDYLLVYPNPSSGDVNLQLYNEYKGEVSVKVYDVTGRLYKTEFIQKDKNSFETKLNWGDLPQGMYLIELTDNLGTKIRKWNKL